MLLWSKSRFSSKNFVKLDLDLILGKKKCDDDLILKYYIPIPKSIFEEKNKIDVESTSVEANMLISPKYKKCFLKKISKKSFKNTFTTPRKILNIGEDSEPKL